MDIYEQLRRDEGLRLKPYADTVGKITIGYGRNLTDKGISVIEAEVLLNNDVQDTTQIMLARLPWFQAIDPVRQGVLKNMAFNLGFSKLEGFPLFLKACAQGDWTAAADEMRDSLWAKEVGERAVRLIQQVRTGVWV